MAEKKFAEKMAILNRHANGLMARLLEVKRVMEGDTRPALFADKQLDMLLKASLKRFPQSDLPRDPKSVVYIKREEIIYELEEAYFVFVDVLEFKDAVMDVVTSMSVSMLHMDLKMTFHPTSAFLELLANYVAVLSLLFKLQDCKAIMTLYTTAVEIQKSSVEQSGPRLGHMLSEYDSPYRKLYEDFLPHGKIVGKALESALQVFLRRHLTAEMLRKENTHSIIHMPAKLAQPSEHEFVLIDMLSHEVLVRWISLGYLLIPGELQRDDVLGLLVLALQESFAIRIFRNETVAIHSAYDSLFSGLKEPKKYAKQKTAIADSANSATTDALVFHAKRRDYIRHVLRQLSLLLGDKPGILGPKAPVVMSALGMARDEVYWLFRHKHTPAPKAKGKMPAELLTDDRFPELLFFMSEMRLLLKQHANIITQYYAEYLSGCDTGVLLQTSGPFTFDGQYETVLLNAIKAETPRASVQARVDLKGTRMDIFRFQTVLSSKMNGGFLEQMTTNAAMAKGLTQFAESLNVIFYHSMLYDSLDELVNDVSGISDVWYYSFQSYFELFKRGLESEDQLRYLGGFCHMCDTFYRGASEFVPEERHEIGNQLFTHTDQFFKYMSHRAGSLIADIASQHVRINERLLPVNAIDDSADKSSKNARRKDKEASSNSENLAALEQKQRCLADICWAINHWPSVAVYNLVFNPREYMTDLLGRSFAQAVPSLCMDEDQVVRPSVCLNRVKAYMAALRNVENFVSVDVASIFSSGLLEQTLQSDPSKPNLSLIYLRFYVDLVMKNQLGITFSPCRQCFVSRNQGSFRAEEYTDLSEMRALCTLLGPFGVRQLNEVLLTNVVAQLAEIKKLALANRDALGVIKTRTEEAQVCDEALRNLRDMEDFTGRFTLVGTILCLRQLLNNALALVLEARIPFIFSSIKDLHAHKEGVPQVDSLAQMAGIPSKTDPQLLLHLQRLIARNAGDYDLWSLVMVMLAASLRFLALSPQSQFKTSLEAVDNNAHCLAWALNDITSAVFVSATPQGEEPGSAIVAEQDEFIRIAVILLLRLNGTSEKDKDTPKNREAMYFVLEQVMKNSPFLTADILEAHIPFSLIRCGLHELYKKRTMRQRSKDDITA
eukprot:m.155851 g.155851  ORF g.155851 m.155851 type:complete len:1117 (+) comp16973_c0_seq1:63-3413(+)